LNIRIEKEIARKKIEKEEEDKYSSILSFSKAAKYFFGSSTTTSDTTSFSTAYSTSYSAPSAADVSVDGEKERRNEEKLRRKKNKQSESKLSRDEAYNDMEEVRYTL
jgi:hypothetical protein